MIARSLFQLSAARLCDNIIRVSYYVSNSTKLSAKSACATNCFLFSFRILTSTWNWKQIVTYDIDVATDCVATDGWIVFEICSKHDKQSIKFLLAVIVWSCIKLSTKTSQWCVITQCIFSELNLVFNVQYNDCVNRLIKGCCANVIRIYSLEVFSSIQVSRLKARSPLVQCTWLQQRLKTSRSDSNLGYESLFTRVRWIKTHSKPTRDIWNWYFNVIKIFRWTSLFGTYWRYTGCVLFCVFNS